MFPPFNIVNDVFAWLNNQFGLKIPLLPLTGWPSIFKTLWNMLIGGELPSGSPPEVIPPPHWHVIYEIPIEGGLDVLPPGSNLDLENLCIFVLEKDS